MVLFVDWKCAKTLHFPALPLHLDAAWAVHSTMDGTVVWRSGTINGSEKLLSCTKAAIRTIAKRAKLPYNEVVVSGSPRCRGL